MTGCSALRDARTDDGWDALVVPRFRPNQAPHLFRAKARMSATLSESSDLCVDLYFECAMQTKQQRINKTMSPRSGLEETPDGAHRLTKATLGVSSASARCFLSASRFYAKRVRLDRKARSLRHGDGGSGRVRCGFIIRQDAGLEIAGQDRRERKRDDEGSLFSLRF